jgi:hypothetical protein
MFACSRIIQRTNGVFSHSQVSPLEDSTLKPDKVDGFSEYLVVNIVLCACETLSKGR